MRSLNMFVLAGLLALPSRAYTQEVGPFGFTFGTSEAGVKLLVPLTPTSRPYVYRVATAPKPHPAFESYLLVITPTQGLCKIIGIGRTFERDAYGTDTKAAFTKLREALTPKYGTPQAYDFLKSGSIWDESREWMMSLYQKERTLAAFWGGEGADSVGHGIQTIGLNAVALSSSSGYVTLAYEATAFDACTKAMDGASDSAL